MYLYCFELVVESTMTDPIAPFTRLDIYGYQVKNNYFFKHSQFLFVVFEMDRWYWVISLQRFCFSLLIFFVNSQKIHLWLDELLLTNLLNRAFKPKWMKSFDETYGYLNVVIMYRVLNEPLVISWRLIKYSFADICYLIRIISLFLST